jgi:hypothetical protein
MKAKFIYLSFKMKETYSNLKCEKEVMKKKHFKFGNRIES